MNFELIATILAGFLGYFWLNFTLTVLQGLALGLTLNQMIGGSDECL